MKKSLLTVAAMATALFAGASVAQAVDVKMGGEFLTRYEYRNQDFNTNTANNDFIGSRVRLNANVNLDDRNSAFVQLQSRQIWGNGDGGSSLGFNPGGSSSVAAGFGGIGNGAPDHNPAASDVHLHQGYFTMRKFFNLPVDVQIGRQELILDGHRLVGNTFWTLGAQSHDAVKVTHSEGDHTLMYFYSINQENSGAVSHSDDTEYKSHIFYWQQRNVLGGAFSMSYIFQDDDRTHTAGDFSAAGGYVPRTGVDNDIHTVGFRQAGTIAQLWDLEYRVEYYYQGGTQSCYSTNAGAAGAFNTQMCGVQTGRMGITRDAYMWGARLGKQFKETMWKPKVTLWYDYVSGDDNANDGVNNAFNTVYDTGHKYYGFMDMFIDASGCNGGSGAAANNVGGTGCRGLQDLAGKFQINPMNKLQVNLDMHAFWTAQDANRSGGGAVANTLATCNAGTAVNLSTCANSRGSRAGSTHLGEELDLTVTYQYTQNILATVGYSHFWSDSLFQAMNGNITNLSGTATTAARGSDQDWLYVMFNVHF